MKVFLHKANNGYWLSYRAIRKRVGLCFFTEKDSLFHAMIEMFLAHNRIDHLKALLRDELEIVYE